MKRIALVMASVLVLTGFAVAVPFIASSSADTATPGTDCSVYQAQATADSNKLPIQSRAQKQAKWRMDKAKKYYLTALHKPASTKKAKAAKSRKVHADQKKLATARQTYYKRVRAVKATRSDRTYWTRMYNSCRSASASASASSSASGSASASTSPSSSASVGLPTDPAALQSVVAGLLNTLPGVGTILPSQLPTSPAELLDILSIFFPGGVPSTLPTSLPIPTSLPTDLPSDLVTTLQGLLGNVPGLGGLLNNLLGGLLGSL